MTTVLDTIKRSLNLSEGDNAFDAEITTYIDMCIADVQTNVNVLLAMDATTPIEQLDTIIDKNFSNLLKSYILLRTRSLFDPPTPTGAPIFERNERRILWLIRENYGIEGVNK